MFIVCLNLSCCYGKAAPEAQSGGNKNKFNGKVALQLGNSHPSDNQKNNHLLDKEFHIQTIIQLGC